MSVGLSILKTTTMSLLQVVNILDTRLFIHKFDASCFNNKSSNIKLNQVMIDR